MPCLLDSEAGARGGGAEAGREGAGDGPAHMHMHKHLSVVAENGVAIEDEMLHRDCPTDTCPARRLSG